jgi:OOP family OmpA-OmpF porin
MRAAPRKNFAMSFRRTSVHLGVALLAGLGAGSALAEQPLGWHGGASFGRSAATIDDAGIRTGLARSGLGTASIEDRDRDTGYKLFGGYQFSRHLAIEAGLFDLGSFGYTARTTPAGTLGGDIRVKGLNLDLVGTLPLTDRFSLLGRVGVAHTQTRGSFGATGAAAVPYGSNSPSARATLPKLGLGMAYQLTDSLSLRLEGERYRIKDAVGHKGDVDMVSAGLVYHFGAPAPRPRAAAPEAPAPVALVAAPAAPPPMVVAAPKPPMRVSLSAGSLFDFDQATIKPAGRVLLDKLSGDLRSVQVDTVRVTGHTDRLGSTAHNQALSQQRAQAVGSYLSQGGAIAAAKIVTAGLGETQPVTQRDDCRGETPTARLIACLQPDRRVDVEVSGSQQAR